MNSRTSEGSLEERLDLSIQWNFSQVEMHGGNTGIEAVDGETGEVQISLTGAYSGCGTSPVTIQALKTCMVAEFERIDAAHTSVGGFYDDEPGAGFEPSMSDVPF